MRWVSFRLCHSTDLKIACIQQRQRSVLGKFSVSNGQIYSTKVLTCSTSNRIGRSTPYPGLFNSISVHSAGTANDFHQDDRITIRRATQSRTSDLLHTIFKSMLTLSSSMSLPEYQYLHILVYHAILFKQHDTGHATRDNPSATWRADMASLVISSRIS